MASRDKSPILKTPWRPPRSQGVIVGQITRGRLHWQKWPRKRGRVRSERLKALNFRFAVVSQLVKFADDQARWITEQLAQHGPVYPRDLLTAAVYGRLFEVIETNEGTFYSMALLNDISHDLDVLNASEIGTILVRTPQGWRGLAPGPEGDVLTSHGPDQTPTWEPLP